MNNQTTRRRLSALPLAFGMLFLAAAAFAQDEEAQPEPRQPNEEQIRLLILQDFDVVWQTVAENYVDPNYNGVDWEAQREEYRPLVEAAPDVVTAYRLMSEMLGKLEDEDTFLVPPWVRAAAGAQAEAQVEQLEYSGVGIMIQQEEVGEDVVVVEVFDGGPAKEAGVLVGDIIVGVDDWEVTDETEITDVTERVKGPTGSTVTLVLRDPDGETRTLEVERRQIDLRAAVEQEYVASGIGYLRIPRLSAEMAEAGAKELPKLLSSRGLILDLRGVTDGTVEGLVRVAQWFLGSARLGSFTTREGTQEVPYRPDAVAAYRRAVVVLTNSATYGMAEILTELLREYDRATVVGNATEGGFQLGQFGQLPSGGLVHVTVGTYQSPSGDPLPDGGIEPDETVEPPDLVTRRERGDVYVEEAIAVLRGDR